MSSTGNAEESLQPSAVSKSFLCPLWLISILQWRDWRYSRFLSRLRRVRNDSLLHFYFLFLFECEYFLKVWHWVGFIIRALNLWRANESYSQRDFLDGIFLLRWI